jgi:hypothetical protein
MITVKSMTCRTDENGIRIRTFEPESFKNIVQDNLDDAVAIVDENDNVVGVLYTRLIWEQLYSDQSVVQDTRQT